MGRGRMRGSDREAPGPEFFQVGDFIASDAHDLRQPVRMLQERRSGDREARRAPAALKKPLAQLGLQRPDLLADRRLREMKRLGGAPETLQGRDGLDGEELIERHDNLLLIVIGFMKKYHL